MPDTAPSETTDKPRQRRPSSKALVLKASAKAVQGLPKPGRPLSYTPDLCERAIALGAKGKSWAAIAREFNISRSTINTWEAEYPEFRDALARARAASQAWWEDHGQKNLKAKHYQAQVSRTMMAAQFEDYRESRAGAGELGFDLTAFVGALGAAIHGPGASAKVIDAQPVKDDAAAEPPPVEGKHR